MRRLWISIVSLVIALTLVLNAVMSPSVKAADGQDILYITISPPATIDPSLASFVSEVQFVYELFAGLVKVDPVSGNSQPDLAESWAWNTAGTEVTFTLRSGLVWSDGHPLTASDARYSILRALDPDTAAEYAGILFPIVNAGEYNNGSITDPSLVGVYADSPTQLRIELTQPMVFFEKIISLWVARPLPQHVIDLHPTDWTQPEYMVESGPYTLTSRTDTHIQMAQNPLYYGPDPDIAQIEVILTDDYDANWNAFLMGHLDTVFLPPPYLPDVQSDPVLLSQMTETAGTCTTGLMFKTDVAPMGNLNVRKALIAAIDRVDFNENVNGTTAISTQTFTPPPYFGYVDGVTEGIGIPSDATQAMAYLTLAGYPNGSGFPDLTILVRDSPRNRARWDYLTNSWFQILNITINVTYTGSNPPRQPISFGGWCGDYNDAYNFLNDGVKLYQNNATLGDWTNPVYDGLMETAALTENPADRLDLYRQAEEILVETDAVMGPIYNNVYQTLTRPYLQRTFSGDDINPWHTWVIETAATAAYDPANPQVFTPGVDPVQYDLPAGLLSAPATLTHTALREDQIPVSPNWMGDTGVAFTLTAVPGGGGKEAYTQTLVPYTITVPYSPEGILPEGINLPERLQVFALVSGAWVAQPSVVDTDLFTVTVTTQEINTTFVLWGDIDYVFLPTIQR